MGIVAGLVGVAERPPVWRKSCLFGILCVSFVNVYLFLCMSFFLFCFEGGTWDLLVLIPDHCLSNYFFDMYFTSILFH